MAIIQLPRQETSLESLSKTVAGLLDTVTQLKIQQGNRRKNQVVMDVIARGGTPEDMASALNSLEQSQGSQGIIQNILGTFNPNKPIYMGQSTAEKALQSGYVSRAFEDPMVKRYRHARTQWAEQQADIGPKSIQPLSTLDITRQAKMMDSYIDSAKNPKWFWRKDYTKENLLNAWNQYKQVNQIESMTPTQQHQIANLWNDRIEQRSRKTKGVIDDAEYDWDPSLIQRNEAGGQMSEVGGKNLSSPYPQYPDAFMENGVWKVIRNDKKYRIEE